MRSLVIKQLMSILFRPCSFGLPKGCFATALLRELVDYTDASPRERKEKDTADEDSIK